jgi:hypothetical protein
MGPALVCIGPTSLGRRKKKKTNIGITQEEERRREWKIDT